MSLTHGFYNGPDRLQLSEHPQSLTSQFSSTTLVYGILGVLLIYHALQYFGYSSLPASELLWNLLVHLTPWRLISALDSRLESKHPAGNKISEEIPAPEKHAAKSEAMRRILGLDGAGIFETVQRTRSLSGLGNLFQSRQSDSPPGLGNWDNSCYQNSVIQGLASMPSLFAFLGRTTDQENPHSTKAALVDIISKLNDPTNAGRLFWTPARLKSMSSWQQQDAQEYFSKVVDEIERDTLKENDGKIKHAGLGSVAELQVPTIDDDNANENSEKRDIPSAGMISGIDQLPDELGSMITRSPLEGLLAQRVGCLACGYVEGLSLIPFNCLTVPLGKQWMYDIRTCLDEYTTLEPIDGVDCIKCTLLYNKKQLERLRTQFYDQDAGDSNPLVPPLSAALLSSVDDRLSAVNSSLDNEDFSDNTLLKKCQIPARSRISTTKSRQAVIARAPRSLVIHVNRSIFNEFSGVQSKNLADVRFPLHFDLTSWCLGIMPSKIDEVEAETWNVNPSTSMLPAEADAEDLRTQEIYELRAVITHYGRHENGHYICYRRHPGISKAEDGAVGPWWRFSDEEVTQVSEENVLSQGGIFMLFYEKSKSQESKGDGGGPGEQKASTTADGESEQVQVDGSLDEAAIEAGTTQKPVPVNESASTTIHPENPILDPVKTEIEPAANKSPEPTTPPASAALSESPVTPPGSRLAGSSLPPPSSTHQPLSSLTSLSEPPQLLRSASPAQPPFSPTDIGTAPPNVTSQGPTGQLSPPPMRTAGPRSVSRASKGMGMGMGGGGMVEAN